MESREEPVSTDYPHGRGYGHDYMRGGEVLGGYGYAERQEYSTSRGELRTGEFRTADGGARASENDGSRQGSPGA